MKKSYHPSVIETKDGKYKSVVEVYEEDKFKEEQVIDTRTFNTSLEAFMNSIRIVKHYPHQDEEL